MTEQHKPEDTENVEVPVTFEVNGGIYMDNESVLMSAHLAMQALQQSDSFTLISRGLAAPIKASGAAEDDQKAFFRAVEVSLAYLMHLIQRDGYLSDEQFDSLKGKGLAILVDQSGTVSASPRIVTEDGVDEAAQEMAREAIENKEAEQENNPPEAPQGYL
jgi:TRAP-type uncharacterized transport system substrate-binding protein